MKYIKKFESIGDDGYDEIHNFCDDHGIYRYEINKDDGTVDILMDVHLDNLGLTQFPIRFGHIDGSFTCENNYLMNLNGGPKTVRGTFVCKHNNLQTLEGGPIKVGSVYNCSNNQLISLKGIPKQMSGNLFCHNNNLKTLQHFPYISGAFDFSNNNLINFNGFPEDLEVSGNYKGWCFGNPVHDIYALFETIRCVKWLNEFDVIQGTNVVLDRLEEVFYQLDKTIPQNLEARLLKNYKLV